MGINRIGLPEFFIGVDKAWRPNLEASPGEIAAEEDFDFEASKE